MVGVCGIFGLSVPFRGSPPAGRVRPGPARHHDLARFLVGLVALDHRPTVDADDPRP
jgi:hypothetical protein